MATRNKKLSQAAVFFPGSYPLGGDQAFKKQLGFVSDFDPPVTSVGRRILATAGLHGASDFLVLDGDNTTSGSQIYPTKTHERTVLITKCRLTPGCRISVVGLACRSGPCQRMGGGGSWVEDSRTGSLIIVATWDNGINQYSRTTEYVVPSSAETYGGEPSAFSAGNISTIKSDIPNPADVEDDDEFGGMVELTIQIKAKGALRLIDVAVYEKPHEVWRDEDDRETTTMNVSGPYPSEYAITGLDLPDDARWGARQYLHNARSQAQYLGPTLWQWSSWDESTATVTQTTPTAVTATTTSFTDLLRSSITSFSESNPGWSMSSGGTSRNPEWSGILELRERDGVIPVTCRVYAKVNSGAITGTVRFQSKDYSLCDLTTSSTSYTWIEGLAWLRCGIHQNLQTVMQLMGKVSAAGTLSVLYASVDYGGHYELVE